MTPARSVHGEELQVPERVIVAPALGVFKPVDLRASGVEVQEGEIVTEGEMVVEGQVVGVVEARGAAHPVRSAFNGFLVGLLAHPGERVREGQPVAWLRVV